MQATVMVLVPILLDVLKELAPCSSKELFSSLQRLKEATSFKNLRLVSILLQQVTCSYACVLWWNYG
jgi:hypothetical protein